ncbi:MAG: hypothetical protein QQW96_13445 [Tychonema bourrellyi B0820]|nr:hypothetical protein [Tychonema bourrellyi]MDQ2098639.1 hypothetical protein [Tychonema bourrellyi B0820]
MPVPQKIHKTSPKKLVKNRQDACSTKSESFVEQASCLFLN